MRCVTAAQMKGTGSRPTQKLPRKGTNTRAVYDQLMANKGTFFKIEHGMKWGRLATILANLTNFYGLDIRYQKLGYGIYHHALVGEWFGKVYVDYTPEAVKSGI